MGRTRPWNRGRRREPASAGTPARTCRRPAARSRPPRGSRSPARAFRGRGRQRAGGGARRATSRSGAPLPDRGTRLHGTRSRRVASACRRCCCSSDAIALKCSATRSNSSREPMRRCASRRAGDCACTAVRPRPSAAGPPIRAGAAFWPTAPAAPPGCPRSARCGGRSRRRDWRPSTPTRPDSRRARPEPRRPARAAVATTGHCGQVFRVNEFAIHCACAITGRFAATTPLAPQPVNEGEPR